MALPYDLRMLIRDNTATAESEVKIIDAVEAHCAAIIAQSKCSTIREQLVQMLKREKRRYADKRVKPYEQSKAFWNITPLEKVIKLIDERQPVA
jgi:hypothetical protein